MSRQVLYDPSQYCKAYAVLTRVPVFAECRETYKGLDIICPSWYFGDGQHMVVVGVPYKATATDVLGILAYEGAFSAVHVATYRVPDNA